MRIGNQTSNFMTVALHASGNRAALALAMAVGFLLLPLSPAASCELSGKSIIIQFIICPQQRIYLPGPPGLENECLESRTRFAIVGKKVAHFEDEITPEGIVYSIGEKVEITDDPVQMKRLSKLNLPQFYPRAWVTASYSGGHLRMLREFNLYYRDDSTLFRKSSFSAVIDVATDCRSCSLTSFVSAFHVKNRQTGKEIRQTRLLDKQISCQVRSGV
jgi:hypothetical protein